MAFVVKADVTPFPWSGIRFALNIQTSNVIKTAVPTAYSGSVKVPLQLWHDSERTWLDERVAIIAEDDELPGATVRTASYIPAVLTVEGVKGGYVSCSVAADIDALIPDGALAEWEQETLLNGTVRAYSIAGNSIRKLTPQTNEGDYLPIDKVELSGRTFKNKAMGVTMAVGDSAPYPIKYRNISQFNGDEKLTELKVRADITDAQFDNLTSVIARRLAARGAKWKSFVSYGLAEAVRCEGGTLYWEKGTRKGAVWNYSGYFVSDDIAKVIQDGAAGAAELEVVIPTGCFANGYVGNCDFFAPGFKIPTEDLGLTFTSKRGGRVFNVKAPPANTDRSPIVTFASVFSGVENEARRLLSSALTTLSDNASVVPSRYRLDMEDWLSDAGKLPSVGYLCEAGQISARNNQYRDNGEWRCGNVTFKTSARTLVLSEIRRSTSEGGETTFDLSDHEPGDELLVFTEGWSLIPAPATTSGSRPVNTARISPLGIQQSAKVCNPKDESETETWLQDCATKYLGDRHTANCYLLRVDWPKIKISLTGFVGSDRAEGRAAVSAVAIAHFKNPNYKK